jgi:2-polyprenyl-3-methyl-5-hydroxy-6-metoxy-1,4-benzoquinol methylase
VSGIKPCGEINGDTRLSPFERLRYLIGNFRRNIGKAARHVSMEPFCRGRIDETAGMPSPGRFLGQEFVLYELPNILPRAKIRVLDVGCGSGRMSDLLAQAGYGGTYVGVDINDRFSHSADARFDRHFICGNAHDLPETETFDLVVSNSALEHIPDDRRLVAKLDRLVAPGGMQVHIVPSGWGLALYLWHGYRQYPLSRIAALFSPDCARVYGLGGLACFAVHFLFISLGEIVLRLDLRRRFPRPYRALLNAAITIDRGLRGCPGMYVVCQPGRTPQANREGEET